MSGIGEGKRTKYFEEEDGRRNLRKGTVNIIVFIHN